MTVIPAEWLVREGAAFYATEVAGAQIPQWLIHESAKLLVAAFEEFGDRDLSLVEEEVA